MTNHATVARLDRMLRRFQLTTGSFNVVQVIAGASEPLTPSAISARIPVAVSTATMTGVLDILARRELTKRHPHPDDCRRIPIHLTQRGSQLLDQVVPLALGHQKQWSASLTRMERVELVAQLAAIQHHLRSLDSKP